MSMQTRWQEDGTDKAGYFAIVARDHRIRSGTGRAQNRYANVASGERDDARLMLIDLGRGQNRLGAVRPLAQVYRELGAEPADLDSPEHLRFFFNTIQSLVANNELLAYHDRSGRWFVGDVGRNGVCRPLWVLKSNCLEVKTTVAALFSEELGAVVSGFRSGLAARFERLSLLLPVMADYVGWTWPCGK